MEKTVTIEQIRQMSLAMRTMADHCDDALERMEKDKLSEIASTNYPSGVRGFVHVLNFVSGVAGTATTSRSKDIIAPLLLELEKVKKDAEAFEEKRSNSRTNKKSK